jgi:hypothetical protein
MANLAHVFYYSGLNPNVLLPVWRKFWKEESATGHYTDGFVEFVNATEPGSFPFLDGK